MYLVEYVLNIGHLIYQTEVLHKEENEFKIFAVKFNYINFYDYNVLTSSLIFNTL